VALTVLMACPGGREPGGGPQLPTLELPSATVGQPYEAYLTASGGVAPLRYSVSEVPPGFSFDADSALLKGTATAVGRFTLNVSVTDAQEAKDSRAYTLEVRGGGGGSDGGVPDAGVGFPLQVGNWNIEWFGDTGTGRGPTDENLQLQNVRTVISGADADFWGLQEVVNVNHFNTLKQGLTGYDGFVANDPRVTSGSNYYGFAEQKVAVLYKTSVVQVLSAQVILGANSFDFGTRPPLRLNLRVTRDGTSVDMVAIVLHMKAETTQADYDRRQAAAAALQQYIDTNLSTARVMVLGDWNDDVDMSITSGQPTPYQNFLNAPSEYTFLTRTLSQSMGSQVRFPTFVDHQLVTNELAQSHVANSSRVLRPSIANYGDTTSDHYPVLSRFDLSKSSAP
jgi:endonuclease/exonuclease/phosphatase family metal-dependent hydrolase